MTHVRYITPLTLLFFALIMGSTTSTAFAQDNDASKLNPFAQGENRFTDTKKQRTTKQEYQYITLRNKKTICGQVIRRNTDTLLVETGGLGRVAIPFSNISATKSVSDCAETNNYSHRVKKKAPVATTPKKTVTRTPPGRKKVIINNRPVRKTPPNRWWVTKKRTNSHAGATSNGATSKKTVKRGPAGKSRKVRKDRKNSRYLYSPSAFTLKEGEGYFSQKQIAFSSMAMGITDNFTILVGSAFPAWLFGAPNFIVGAKLGNEITENFHMAVGVETFNFYYNGMGSLVLPFGTMTWGDKNLNASISLGAPLTQGEEMAVNTGNAMMSLSLFHQLSDNVGFVTENWFFFDADPVGLPTSLHALALRFDALTSTGSVDLGLIYTRVNNQLSIAPVPWLDYTYSW